MHDFETMRIFVEVVEKGSFSEVARDRNVAISSIARQISALERAYGVHLLNRTTRHHGLTEVGHIFFDRTKTLLAELAAAKEDVEALGGTARGLLRVHVRSSAAHTMVVPALPDFLARHPAIDMDILATDERADLAGQHIDAAIWLGPSSSDTLESIRLTDIRYIVCASPQYLAAAGTPRHPDELRNHICLGYRHESFGDSWIFNQGEQRLSVPIRAAVRSTSGAALVECSFNGAGIIAAQSWIVGQALAEGRLVQILAEWTMRPVDIDTALYLVMPRKDRPSPNAAAFRDFVVPLFAPHRDAEACAANA